MAGYFDCLLKYFNQKVKRRVKILQKGQKRMEKQVDIVKYLRKQMVLDILLKLQLKRAERYLAEH